MGFNGIDAHRVIFDLETIALPDAEQFLDPPKANRTLKDPEKIKADLAEKAAHQLDGCSLDPDLCQIVAIGWMYEHDTADNVAVLSIDEISEALLLKSFWMGLGQRVTVGYNSLGFDLPILLRRSLYLGVPTPTISLDKYRSNHIDLQQRLSFNGVRPYRSLGWYCRRFGVDVPPDDTSGADIAALVMEGDWAKVRHHCKADVLKTAALARRMGIISQQQVEAVL